MLSHEASSIMTVTKGEQYNLLGHSIDLTSLKIVVIKIEVHGTTFILSGHEGP